MIDPVPETNFVRDWDLCGLCHNQTHRTCDGSTWHRFWYLFGKRGIVTDFAPFRYAQSLRIVAFRKGPDRTENRAETTQKPMDFGSPISCRRVCREPGFVANVKRP